MSSRPIWRDLGILMQRCSFREKTKLVLKATRQHARNLATFAFIYKAAMIVLRSVNPTAVGKEGRYDSFFAGALGGYAVFGRRKTSVTQQVWQLLLRCNFVAWNRLANSGLADCHLCLCPCGSRHGQTLRGARHAPLLFSHHPRIAIRYPKECMAGLCQSQLGVRHVHFPLVPRDADVESAEQHGVYVSADQSSPTISR